ncbi:MAG: SRPBCC domain-containing protein [Solirubrobacterales bacterium]|nr:SRPBCC domain-containing protein [Solirubrobacterales bacterium]
MTTDSESHEFEVQRLIAAAPEQVFDGFVDLHGEGQPDWILGSNLDLRVGGEWTVEFRPPGLDAITEVRTITELDRPRRLAYSMTTSSEDPGERLSTEVAFSFESRDGETLVKLDQRGFTSKTQAEGFEQAWPQVLDLLAERVDG